MFERKQSRVLGDGRFAHGVSRLRPRRVGIVSWGGAIVGGGGGGGGGGLIGVSVVFGFDC